MATIIKLKNSNTPGAIPTSSNLSTGEVAVNLSDKKVYAKDNLGNVNILASEH